MSRPQALKIILYVAILSTWTSSYGQLDKLKGTWISPAQELISIDDTVSHNNNNYLSNAQLQDRNFVLALLSDTLSFQNKYYSSADGYRKIYVDRHDLKVVRLTDTTLEVKPVSEFSRKFFQDKDRLVFTRQQFAVDTTIRFEKIVFHTTRCFGSCPVYHLQIDSSRRLLLNANTVYKDRSFQADSSAQGYFKGQLSVTSFRNLLTSLKTCNLQTLKMEEVLCCDAPVVTIIVYFNGQRKYYKTMFPPRIVNELIKTLREICEEKNLTRVNETFILEE